VEGVVDYVNGVYRLSTEVANGKPVYHKQVGPTGSPIRQLYAGTPSDNLDDANDSCLWYRGKWAISRTGKISSPRISSHARNHEIGA
jgi:hypothetical protein